MKAQPFRWGLIGYGDLAEKRAASALEQAPGHTLAALWGRSEERTADFARRHSIPLAARSLDELWEAGLDAVYVCTPPDSHRQYTLAALARKIPVLVEKPMADTAEAAEEMAAAAAREQTTLGVAYYRRAFPKMQEVARLIADGVLGTPVWASAVAHSWFARKPGEPKSWRVEPKTSGGAGALADIGVHRLDLLDYWFGELTLDQAAFTHLVQDYAVEDGSALALRLPNGAPVQTFFSWNSKTWVDRMELVGSEGKILMEPLDGAGLTVIRGRDREEREIAAPANAHLPCVEDFVRACREGSPPLCDAAAGLRTSRLLEQCVRLGSLSSPV
jgi:predicted dehydrogenase